MADFAPAPPEIVGTANRLIAAYFPNLAGAAIAILVRPTPQEAGQGEDGQNQSSVAAAGVNPDPKLPYEYVIWFAWDVWQLLDGIERDAIVFHELMHLGRDATGKPVLTPHDESVFTREVELYGAWWKDAQAKFKALGDPQG